MPTSKDSVILERCRYFCEGRHCWKGENCSLIHDIALRRAAMKQKKTAEAHLSPIVSSPGIIQPDEDHNPASVVLLDVKHIQTDEIIIHSSVPTSNPNKRSKKKRTNGVVSKNAPRLEEDEGETSHSRHRFSTNEAFVIDKQNHHAGEPYVEPHQIGKLALRPKSCHQNSNSAATISTYNFLEQPLWQSVEELSLESPITPAPVNTWVTDQHRMDRWSSGQYNSHHKGHFPPVKPTPENQSRITPVKEARKLSSGNLDYFTLFPNLPVELRLEIWKFALHIPYTSSVLVDVPLNNRHEVNITSICCRSPTPPLLRICHESRIEALQHYKLCFGNTTYFNYKTDMVYFSTPKSHPLSSQLSSFVKCLKSDEIDNIQNLSMKLQTWVVADHNFKPDLWKFKSLKRLILRGEHGLDDQFLLNSQCRFVVREDLKQGSEKLDYPYKVPKVYIDSTGIHPQGSD